MLIYTLCIYVCYFQTLEAASKVSKKEAKQMTAKVQLTTKKSSPSISSPNIDVPSQHSEFYDEYKGRLISHRHILDEPLTSQNYKEKFHLLLAWEEQEHDKQLAER